MRQACERRRPRRWQAILIAGSCALTLGADTAVAGNLLLNSSFTLASNGVTPDYWDLHHAAALRFRNLYEQYNLVDTPAAPVAGARVLKIVNSEAEFPYVYLLSKIRESKWPAGDYVFSVYIKADRAGSQVNLVPSLDRLGEGASRSVTVGWQRYSARFRIDDSDKAQISPLVAFPRRGTFWIAAPQLQAGETPTAYAPSPDDADLGVKSEVQRRAAAEAAAAISDATAGASRAGLSAMIEFDRYSGEPAARLRITDDLNPAWQGTIECRNPAAPHDLTPFFSSAVALSRGQARMVDIPISGLANGEYGCNAVGMNESASAGLTILAPNSVIVRVNRWRRTININGAGFHLRGIMVGGYVPPEWYFADITAHGINTLFFFPGEDAAGALKYGDLDQVVRLSAQSGLKLVIGPPVMGQKSAGWGPLLERYTRLIKRYRDSPTIIGWFVVDEPQAWTLQKDDLREIYRSVKSLDPYRIAFINWGSDDVPAGVGAEPHGTLAATDLYSIDYYPFTNRNTNLENYTLRTVRAFETGSMKGTPGHSWLQLFGDLDVIREPTGEELNFMAYVNLLFGANYSYWQTKSNAEPTWNRLGKTNKEIDALENLLMLNPSASELAGPKFERHYLYSAWRTPEHDYLIVVHVGDQRESFTIDLASVVGARALRAHTMFGGDAADLQNSRLSDSFDAYATRVYELN